jgi:cell division protease FtsH
MTGFGLMALDLDEQLPFLGYEIAQGRTYSEETAARVDEEVQKLLKERYVFTRTCLEEHRTALDELVNELMAHEMVNQETLIKILGPLPE